MRLGNYRRETMIRHPSVSREDSEVLISQVLGIPRLELVLHDGRELSEDETDSISSMVTRRDGGEPLQYILGEAPFRNLMLSVGTGVLIPRPETEMLVDLALKEISSGSCVLELGTGSGAISISIALEMPGCMVMATDISEHALGYARANIAKYGENNIRLFRGNLFDALPAGYKFDLIVANLPYVSSAIYEGLEREVRDFEPATSLVCAEEGLELIRLTVEGAPAHFSHGGTLILEFSPEQKKKIISILKNNQFKDIQIKKDLNSRARFAKATQP
ncbi:MAG: peptide chain release factor N(5)-glutamine methyltransferase [Victivallales bacterium]|nr:peptide chain release factor N(5)-glutamine methyltransferase [Victivallales bacterium]